MPASAEFKRDRIIELLLECKDRKPVRGDNSLALALAEEAYKLSRHTYPIWRRVAAYRLAHLRMRTVGNDEVALQKIDQLFREVTAGNELDPLRIMAGVYRLAVLHRLAAVISGEQARKRILDEIRRAHGSVVKMMNDSRFFGDRLDESAGRDETRKAREIIHTEVFNLFELATYFLGEKYDSLAGLGRRASIWETAKHGWYVVGTGVSKLEMCEELAKSELANRAAQHPEAVTFEFPNKRPRSSRTLYLKRGKDQKKKINPAALTLLTCLLVGEIRSMDDLRSKVVAARDRAERKDFGDDAGYVRKLKERLGKTLAELLGLPGI